MNGKNCQNASSGQEEEWTKFVTPTMILIGIAEYYNLDPVAMTSGIRNVKYIRPRLVFLWLCKEMIDIPLYHIRILLNIQGCWNMFHFYNKICTEMETDEELRKKVEEIRKLIEKISRERIS